MVIDLSEVTKAKSFAQVFFLQKINKVKIYSLFNSVKKSVDCREYSKKSNTLSHMHKSN